MKQKIILFALCLSFCCCNATINWHHDCGDLKELKIINRTGNKKLIDSVTISKTSELETFCQLMAERVKIGEANIKSNFGFYEIIVTKKDNKEGNILVLYTMYDGVVIKDDGYYRQNKIIDFILQNLSSKNRL